MLKLKILLLSCMFVIVVFVMYGLNTRGIKVGFLPEAQSLSWCPTRIIEIVEENPISSFRVFNDNGKWIKEADRKVTLPSSVMEKWLGQNCSLKLDEKLPPPHEVPRELGNIRVKMANGQIKEFHRYYGGLYTYGGVWFKSNNWDAALAQLATF